MTQSIGEPVVTKRFVHPNGTVSHFHVRGGRVLLTSVHPEHAGNPAEMDRAEVLRAWDAVTEQAEADGLLG
ncbi:hypothetical protein D3273_06670 [Lichenibacterium minor]|jgi:hypothetical protein|uniref:Uncharacterized protein n=1 Tax=Lichenibacterium minor TaxID=2316528 RepID=A0A4Q2U7S8_9HYPH|nr:hypothetical protein [Lichenibacterium minor]RYC32763.1 hypothetical protein D3273_06670 [Lichenibacterium minor]